MVGDLTDIQIEHLLHTAFVGRIGCCANERPYLVPIAFVYQDGCIYCHSGLGLKVEMMRANPIVCFEVDRVENLGNWQSAILQGTYEELEGAERETGLRLLVERLSLLGTMKEQDDQPHDVPDVGSTQHFLRRSIHHGVVFRIRIAEMTGRFEKR